MGVLSFRNLLGRIFPSGATGVNITGPLGFTTTPGGVADAIIARAGAGSVSISNGGANTTTLTAGGSNTLGTNGPLAAGGFISTPSSIIALSNVGGLYAGTSQDVGLIRVATGAWRIVNLNGAYTQSADLTLSGASTTGGSVITTGGPFIVGGYLSVSGDLAAGASSSFNWNGRVVVRSPTTSSVRFANNGETNSFDITIGASNLATFNGPVKTSSSTVAGLPAAATVGAGARSFVTDGLTPVFGNTVTGGGAIPVPVYSDGSAWKVG